VSDMSLASAGIAAISALGGALVALLAAGVRIGALTQRLAVAESRIVDESAKCETDRRTAIERASKLALYEHRVQQAEAVAEAARREIIAVERAQTQLAAEHDATREVLGDVRSTIKDMSKKIDRLLGLQVDTPAHGLSSTSRD